MRVPPFVFRVLHPVRSAYRRIVRPTRYGVKALVIHPADSDRVLLVRHSYGDRSLWRLPGGGYRPARETPEQAARRECVEELGMETEPSGLVLEEHLTTRGGGHRHLTIVRLHAISDGVTRSGEISEARWVALDLSGLPGDAAVSRWVRSALRAHAKA